MKRNFDEHVIRKTQSLDGAWRFSTDKNLVGEDEKWYLGIPSYETVEVPSVWNEYSGLLEYEGVCWYEREFFFEGGTLRLEFGAVMTYARVWLDGEYLGDHYGGFTQFDFKVTDLAPGTHRVSVRVDNRFDSHSIPQTKVDWYHYGGIIRGVTAEKLSGVSILSCKFCYELFPGSALCSPILEIYGAEDTTDTVHFIFDIMEFTNQKVSIRKGETKSILLPHFLLPSPELWSPDSPKLYNICVKSATDDLRDRVGFRKVEVCPEGVLINGVLTELRGVNRHDEYPTFGFAFPDSRIKHDIELIEDLGCNTVRGSHYPNSHKFIDYLDERGLAFWSEIPIWGCGFSADALGDELVLERGLQMHREMAKYYYNHPSIIIWGMHNEIPSDSQNAYAMSKKYYECLKDQGGNRLVTYASHMPMTDICFEFCDIICLNMYFGWYSGGMEAWDKFITDFAKRRDSLGFAHKPIIFSEFGAGALYGFHDAECPRWSEEYQAKLLTHCLTLFRNRPEVVGSYVWQFCDIRTSADMGYTRARGFNNKGIMNEWRRPKASYYAVKDCYKR